VCVEASVPGCAREILILLVWYVLVGFRISKAFSESKVYAIYLVGTLSRSHEEIVWLDVPAALQLLLHTIAIAHHIIIPAC
jgi:hypothetical protein